MLKRTFRLDRLLHKFKTPATLLDELARRLYAAGFIETIGYDRYSENDKLTNQENKKELFNLIRGIKNDFK